MKKYIAAMPGWKRDIGRRIDAIIERVVPDVYKAVKWNSPFYGFEGKGWFLACIATRSTCSSRSSAARRSIPPPAQDVEASEHVRYFDMREDAPLDEAQLESWVKQASELPGEKL